MAERRKINRSELKGLINYYETQFATSRNISSKGIAINSSQPIEEGTPLYLKIPKNDNTYSYRLGIAIRCIPHNEGYFEIAVKFTNKHPIQQRTTTESSGQSHSKGERRSSKRINRVTTIQFSPLMKGMMKNFNDAGLCLFTKGHFKPNQPIYLLKPISATNQLMIKGVVVWQKANSKGLRQSGIRFENVKVIQKSRFIDLFSKALVSHFKNDPDSSKKHLCCCH